MRVPGLWRKGQFVLELIEDRLKPGFYWGFDVAAEVEDPGSAGAATHKAYLWDGL